ncbi:MAG: hypothetical protein AAFP97_11830 [Pseudomonadota bacterium]
MNTPTHALVALAALSKKDQPKRNWIILIGALIPDLVIFIWAPWQRWIVGRDWGAIWDTHYFEPPMQTAIALFNSVPIFAALLFIGWWQRTSRWGVLLILFSLAALLHIALDLPVHAHDAYRHFWPLSEWRFYSPISYWETDLHARWVSLIEALIVLMSVVVLWVRFPKRWVRSILAILLILTAAATLAQQLAVIGSAR